MAKDIKNGVLRARYTKEFFYVIDGKKSAKTYSSSVTCAKDYTLHLIKIKPQYKEFLSGKTWREIFKILDITLHV